MAHSSERCAFDESSPLQAVGLPHGPCKYRVEFLGLYGCTTQRSGCQTSLRKRVEEIFGWIKTVGGLRGSPTFEG